ncbi:MAG: type I 3-dehydroquinate dehydratase [Ruminococcaceae bacterium]|nr:type I 3-dehydroquinate dehydratase [Oscillospiraceae bacterium]
MQNKPTFLNQSRPLLTCMIQARTPADAMLTIRNAAFDGCDAYGFQQCQMERQYRDDKTMRNLFAQMCGKPVYVTNYRGAQNQGMTDDELADGLVTLIRQGATLADVIGDFFCPDPIQLTMDPGAVDKQRRLIDRIHEAGGEVLMSSHVLKYTPAEEVLRIAFEQKKRGADVVKIVTAGNSDEEELDNLRTTQLLAGELDIPFLFLSGGTHNKRHRTLGFAFGCNMILCVDRYDSLSTQSQPLLHAMRKIVDHLDYYPNIRP